MADFSHIRRQEVTIPTARHTFYEIKGEPWVEVKPATEWNKGFFNALLKRQRRGRRLQRAGTLTVDGIKRMRDEDRELYSKHIVAGWGGVVDVDGRAVELSPDNCCDFLHAIPDESFDMLRDFAGDSQTFVEDVVTDTEETGKN